MTAPCCEPLLQVQHVDVFISGASNLYRAKSRHDAGTVTIASAHHHRHPVAAATTADIVESGLEHGGDERTAIWREPIAEPVSDRHDHEVGARHWLTIRTGYDEVPLVRGDGNNGAEVVVEHEKPEVVGRGRSEMAIQGVVPNPRLQSRIRAAAFERSQAGLITRRGRTMVEPRRIHRL